MGLNVAAASGPAGPSVQTVARNDRLVTSLVANEFVGIWRNRPAHAEVCNRGWQSEWYGSQVHGDTLRIPVLPRYRVTEGYKTADEDSFDGQKELAPFVDLHFRQPNKLETSYDMFDKGLYISPKLEMEKAKRQVESLVDTVETDIAKQEVEGYRRGAQSVSYPAMNATAANSHCVAYGPESTNFPGVSVYTRARASLISRGVTRRELCALLSPEAQEAFSRTALNAQYEYKWAGQAQGKAMVAGPGMLGLKMTESVHNGTFSYGNLLMTTTPQVQAAPAAGTSQIVITGIPNGQTVPKDTYVSFGGSNAVNEVLGNAATVLESYRVTADAVAAGGRCTLQLDHPIEWRTTGEFKRTRNCTKQPAVNDQVFFNGADTAQTGVRFAFQNATVEQSMIVSRDACALVVAQPELPTGDTITARMVSAESYRVAAAHIKWFDGDRKQYRKSLIMRWAAGVLEPIAGIILRGADAAGGGTLI